MGFPGDRITQLRKARGLNQTEFAEIMNLTQNQVSRYETGNAEPRLETLAELAKFFETTTDYLLGISHIPHPHIDPDLSPAKTEMLTLMDTQTENAQQKLVAAVRLLLEMGEE